MSKKKTTIVDQTAEVNALLDRELTNDLGVPVKDGNIVVEEDKPVEVTPEEPKAPEEKIADFDPEKFAEQTAIKVKDALKADEEAKKEEVKKEEEKIKEVDELIPSYVREGRNPKDYAEINDEAQRIAEIKFNRILENREVEAKQKSEEQAKAREAELAKSQKFEEDFNKMVDEELTELYANNKLPKIINDKDANDPGLKARFELFKTMKEVNEKRVSENQPPITSVSRIYNNYYKPTESQPAGADAPISTGKTIVADTNDEVMPYHKLHNSSFLDFFRKK